MKKIIILFLFFTLSACSNVDLEKMLLANDFDLIYDNLQDHLKQSITSEQLRDVVYNECSEFISLESSNDNVMIFNNTQGKCQVLYQTVNSEISSFVIKHIPDKQIESNTSFKESIIIVNDDIMLEGVLNEPIENDYQNLVILVHGSGQSDYNSSIGGVKPFRDIAYGLSDFDIASIRFDKRYYAYPHLATNNIDVSDEILDDVALIIDKYGDDYENVTIVGHSLGAMLAFRIAYENDVDNIILMAGSNRDLIDIMYDQLSTQIINSDLELEQLDDSINQLNDMVKQVKELKSNSNGTYFNLSAKYWQSLNESKPELFIDDLDVNILAMHGDDDFQLTIKDDFSSLKDLLIDYDNATFKQYEGLNHLFTKSINNDVSDYELNMCVEYKVISDMAYWILNLEDK